MTEREQLLAAIEALDAGETGRAAYLVSEAYFTLSRRAICGMCSVSIGPDGVKRFNEFGKEIKP